MLGSFSWLLQEYRKCFGIYHELNKYHLLSLRKDTTGLHFNIKYDHRMSIDSLKILDDLKDKPSSQIEIYTYAQAIKNGPKIFRPTVMQLAMLEEMELNIDIDDYVQPFETVIIELPDDYVKQKEAILPQAGKLHCGEMLPSSHHPVCAIVHFDKKCDLILTSTIFNTGLSMKLSLTFHEERNIEKYLNQTDTQFDDSLDVSPEETKVNNAVTRSCLNYCLLLDEIGIKNLGAKNPAHYERMLRRREKCKDQKQMAELSREIKNHPFIYDLNQDIKLYRTVDSHDQLPSVSTGEKKHPHHRRGHYRQQACGPKYSLRKRIRIAPVFVNSQLFCGDLSNTKVVYHG